MTAKPDPAKAYAAAAAIPDVAVLDDGLIRLMLVNAFQAGMVAGLQEVAEKLEKAEWLRQLHKSPFC